MADQPATASFADFARTLGRSRSWVTQLRQAGRLVLTPNGRLVLVAESLALIEATRDPAKDGVAARHAAERAARAGQGGAQPHVAPSPPPAPVDDAEDETPDAPVSSTFQHWREREQRAKALAAERANEIADGKLLLAEDAKAANAQAFTVVRIEMEQLAETLAPQMIGLTDEARARGLMVEAVEHALAECARRLNDLAREPAR
jgi:hypothetical protein